MEINFAVARYFPYKIVHWSFEFSLSCFLYDVQQSQNVIKLTINILNIRYIF